MMIYSRLMEIAENRELEEVGQTTAWSPQKSCSFATKLLMLKELQTSSDVVTGNVVLHAYVYKHVSISFERMCQHLCGFCRYHFFSPLGASLQFDDFWDEIDWPPSRHASNFNPQFQAGSEKWGSGNLPRAGGAGGVAFANLGGVDALWIRRKKLRCWKCVASEASFWISLYNTYIQIAYKSHRSLYDLSFGLET